MIDENAATLALRNRMLGLLVCTTGSVTLSATAAGYARSSGSFLTDGFADGMEFTASGFATSGNNGVRVIETVSALSLVTTTATTVEGAAAARTLLAGLPVGRAFDNRVFTPVSGHPYIEEDFVPGGHSLMGQSRGGYNNEDGLYIITWYGLEGKGTGGIRKPVKALKALFAPGTNLAAGSDTIRVRTDTSVKSGQILPQGNGWARCTVTIPWWALSNNAIAA